MTPQYLLEQPLNIWLVITFCSLHHHSYLSWLLILNLEKESLIWLLLLEVKLLTSVNWWRTKECCLLMMWRKNDWSHWQPIFKDLEFRTQWSRTMMDENTQLSWLALIEFYLMLLVLVLELLPEIQLSKVLNQQRKFSSCPIFKRNFYLQQLTVLMHIPKQEASLYTQPVQSQSRRMNGSLTMHYNTDM